MNAAIWCTALINIVIPSCMIRFADNRSSVWKYGGIYGAGCGSMRIIR